MLITVVTKINQTGKHFIISNKSVRPINGTLTGTIILDQSGAGSNGNEGVPSHFLEF